MLRQRGTHTKFHNLIRWLTKSNYIIRWVEQDQERLTRLTKKR